MWGLFFSLFVYLTLKINPFSPLVYIILQPQKEANTNNVDNLALFLTINQAYFQTLNYS